MTATAEQKMDDAVRNAMAVVSAFLQPQQDSTEEAVNAIVRDIGMSDPSDAVAAFGSIALALLHELADATGLPEAQLWQSFTTTAAVTMNRREDTDG